MSWPRYTTTMATISKVRPKIPFWDKLQKDECKSVSEFYSHANKIMRLETAHKFVRARKPTPSEKSNDNDKKWKNRDRRPSPEKTNNKAKASDLRVLWPPPGKFINYTDLVSLREDVFMAAEQTGVFRYVETTPKGTRISTAGSIKTLVTPPRSSSPLKTR